MIGVFKMTTKEDISKWFDQGLSDGHQILLVVCDTFSYEDYPVYCNLDNFKTKFEEYDKNMQSVIEIYNLYAEKEEQLNKHLNFYLPN